MAKGQVIWFSLLLLSSTFGQPTPQTCSSCLSCDYQEPDPCPEYSDPYPSCFDPAPCPCESGIDPRSLADSGDVVELRPCNPSDSGINYVYGQAPAGAVLVKPGRIRFPRPNPITVRPGRIALPTPPSIYVRPAAIQPPTPAPITVNPPPVQPATPPPFYVRVPPVRPPSPRPMIVRPPPVKVPRPLPIKVQPKPVQPPVPDNLVVQLPRFSIAGSPTICFSPDPCSRVNTLGTPTISARPCSYSQQYNPCDQSCS